jgi:hypothetical protein
MPGLDPGIHDLLPLFQDVDGRVKPGHDDDESFRGTRLRVNPESRDYSLEIPGSRFARPGMTTYC